ncbi:hypothetical protein EZV62_009845 [Acer yangbiense]|uniref:Myb/SANT-like domain-containing protein n=1 Tax=Acer yangbiense TaxID=1000413 RepID=A0A5C7I0K2_9ROSI|nr:hypothetical protein EZV62_009845 [Acer yangbiense]
MRSGETVSKYFHNVLHSVIRLHGELLKRPEPIPENSIDERWKWFKNCLGALDGTHVKVRVPMSEKPKYRNRKGDISTNVLGVCSQDMQFIYVLLGWEGFAANGRVLRDAIRRTNGLRVPHGYYYFVDAGYTNCTGFFAPFCGQRREMSDDGNDVILEESDDDEANESITSVEPSDEWSAMRMTLAGHIKMDTSKTKGLSQNKRFWTEEEDNKLIESLLELNNDGRFKAEGSFKPGHLKELEKKLHEKLSGCDLLAKPHIESRMKTLKTNFQIVHDMLTGPNCSGFGWDTERKTVTAEKPVWDAYIQSHKEAAPFKLKSFPYYDELSMIFGKDRATGQHAETPADVEEQLQNEGGDYNPDDYASTEDVNNASDNNVDIHSGDLAAALTESTMTLAAVIEKSSARLSKAIVEDLNDKHMQLGEELSRTTTLTIMDRHKVYRLIVQDNALVSYFFSLPDELKDDWAKGILAGTI